MKPVPTRFGGVMYRSRTEARWAAFFQELGAVAEYEPEGFDLPVVGRYLPDFFLHAWDIYVEIKGPSPSEKGRAKAAALASNTGKAVLLIAGAPGISARGWLFVNSQA